MTSIIQRIVRATAQRLVGYGFPVPAIALSRLSEYKQLRDVLHEQAINCMIDVGANRGQFGLLARRLGYHGIIHSFEPMGQAFHILGKRSARDPFWSCHQQALGESTGTKSLKVNRRYQEMSSLLAVDKSYGSTQLAEIEVVPLDSIYDDLISEAQEPATFLKIDTEGYDLNVFRGAKGSLPTIRAVLIEVFTQPIYQGAPHYLDVLAEVESEGFELEHISVVSTTFDNKLLCLNALMVRSRNGGGVTKSPH